MATPGPKPKPFLDRVKIDKETGCWLWQGSLFKNGYGQCKLQGRNLLAHRVSYLLFVGEIPEGSTIDHVAARGCRYKHCVNPEHLEVVSIRENILRGNGAAAKNARRTHCEHGHEFTPQNTIRIKKGRRCRACHNRYNRELAARKRER